MQPTQSYKLPYKTMSRAQSLKGAIAEPTRSKEGSTWPVYMLSEVVQYCEEVEKDLHAPLTTSLLAAS